MDNKGWRLDSPERCQKEEATQTYGNLLLTIQSRVILKTVKPLKARERKRATSLARNGTRNALLVGSEAFL